MSLGMSLLFQVILQLNRTKEQAQTTKKHMVIRLFICYHDFLLNIILEFRDGYDRFMIY